ncbi:helix-turn-helix domain-containing protein [Saccharopolyspora dendranthemae]|uniref:Transcriptional regulator with XRE-family HTH domain n=1 Tax=Saccharopolyspora dendranthemae TaxID=1181886 RepID=A0A561U5T8_9PSEU|nr:helix-turn-helix transcriptional regulator [Saccharopolyspora dendranthemae]TWF94721.1 transcriptional regulator with XRE-family HTH domain [Saccharopolyspora dendranthemae]
MEIVRTSPTFRRRRLARRIRRLRESAGITQEHAAASLDMSTSALSRKETGEVGTSVHEVRSMMDLYDVYDPGLVDLARSAKAKPWWHAYGITSRGYYDLEEEAVSVRDWQPSFVPGLLQTEDYARGVFEGVSVLEAEEIDRAVAARMRRRHRLHDSDAPLHLSALVDESVLRRPVGGPAVMRGQLVALLGFIDLPTVELRVLPVVAGAHRGLEGSFTLLSYADVDEDDVLFLEHAAGSLHIDKPDAVSTAASTFEQMRVSALNDEDSAALISRLVSDC